MNESIIYSNISISDTKKIFGFLSRTIYQELINFGIDMDYIFSLFLHFNWSILKVYPSVSNEERIQVTKEIFEEYKHVYSINDDSISDDYINNKENQEVFEAIFENIYLNKTMSNWLYDWELLCKECYKNDKYTIRVCISLLTAINECLNIGYIETYISLRILLRLQKDLLEQNEI